MTDDVKKFLEEASKNPKIQEKLIKANNDYFQAVIDAAKELGTSLTNEDIALLLKADKNHDGKISKEELDSLKAEELQDDKISNDELANAAGGSYCWDPGYKVFKSDCGCALGGGGTADKYQKTCACIFAGAGELTDYGKQEVANGHIYSVGSSSAPVAMWCAFAGDGKP